MDPTATAVISGFLTVKFAIRLVHVLLALRATPYQATLVCVILVKAIRRIFAGDNHNILMRTTIAKVAKKIALIVTVTVIYGVSQQVIVWQGNVNQHILKRHV